MGKTLLIEKILNFSEKEGYRTVKIDFKQADNRVLIDYEAFLKWFCFYISDSLKMDNNINQDWQLLAGLSRNCTLYFEKHFLSTNQSDLVLALDSFEVLFSYPVIFEDFCSLLRSWHDSKGQSYVGRIWGKLRLIISKSTENYPKLKLHRSPFNVGKTFELQEFAIQQVKELLKIYQLERQLQEKELECLISLTGGHPYLIQQAFFALKYQLISVEKIIYTSYTDEGIFIDHLREKLENLRSIRRLDQAYKNVIKSVQPVKLDSELRFKLRSLGLIKFVGGNDCVSSCDLYRRYFLEHL